MFSQLSVEARCETVILKIDATLHVCSREGKSTHPHGISDGSYADMISVQTLPGCLPNWERYLHLRPLVSLGRLLLRTRRKQNSLANILRNILLI